MKLIAGCARALAALGLWYLLSQTPAATAGTRVINIPVYLDYPLLRHVLVTQLFATPDGTRDILDDPGGCSRIVLSDPQITGRDEVLEFQADVTARLGVGAFGGCQALSNWQGRIGVLGRPVIQPGGRKVKLEPQSVWLVDSAGQKITSGPLWTAGDESLKTLLGGFVVDFTPYFDSLGDFIPAVLPGRSTEQLQAIVGSLTLSEVQVTPANMAVSIRMEVEVPDEPPPPPAAALSEQELADLETRWQMMDALLVGAIKHYAAATDLQPLRSALLDILLDSRYRLRDALTESPEETGDAVRHWFIDSWHSLAPVVRSIALEQEGQENLIWFSVLTATDALYALDQLGPALGLDISANGLRQLARMINAGQVEELLQYSEEVDPELQRLLREQIQAAEPAAEPSAMRLHFSLFPRAHAAAARDLNRWVPSTDDLDHYLPRVASLLTDTAANLARQDRLESGYQSLYRKMVLTTAWQESCWRQYVVINKRIEPLRSNSGDVGIMQVNERVWRGFYDLQKLRWDIDYNSSAGAEVLLNYLVKYALKQGEQKRPGGLNNLARSSYSAYNGGPAQVSRYRRSNVAAAQRKIDELFWEKYRQVDAGKEMNVAKCLGGEVAKSAYSPATVSATAKSPGATKPAPAAAPADAGNQWVRSQPAQHYTLQLGAFSTREAAANFIRQQSFPAPVHVFSLHKGKAVQYLVLHGSFSTREQADPARARYSKLKPWLRKFGDLR